MAELILSLRDRELARFSIEAVCTTIGRDPSSDVVIDNAGVSRVHASVEVTSDGFVVKDHASQNGITLNGEPCSGSRLEHGDVIGINKFLLRFSNQSLAVPEDLKTPSQQPVAAVPKDVQRTLHLDAGSAQALAEVARQQIARKRAEIAANGGQSFGPPGVDAAVASPSPSRPRASLRWEEPAGSRTSTFLFLGGVVVGGAVAAGLLALVL